MPPAITPAGTGIQWDAPPLASGARYEIVAGGTPLLAFTTRSARPLAAGPRLVAIDGTDPATFEAAPFRPLVESSTIRLVFNEPLDPRSLALAPGSIELLDAADQPVPALLVANGIHVAIDPTDDLVAGATYHLRLGNQISDLDGHAAPALDLPLVPLATRPAQPITTVLRTRMPGDPGPAISRAGATPNTIALTKPLIGREEATLQASTLVAELADPTALGGPIAFTIRRGGRLAASGLDVKLAGGIPAGLSTGDIRIELLTDAGGRMYRNPFHPADQRPENAGAPLYVDLVLDLAIYATDPTGNAVLSQTILGVQATGTAIATDGVLAIEAVATMELGLLGIANAPTNFVMELVTDEKASPEVDAIAPALLASAPLADGDAHPVGAGIELIFDEPIDLARGSITLLDGATPVASTIESHGAAIVVRPRAPLAYDRAYRVELADVADVAGNPLAATSLAFRTEPLRGTDIPLTVTSVYPGAPCTLSNGRCAGGAGSDDQYKSFSLPANEPIAVGFTQPLVAASVTLGLACGQGSVRIEELDAQGACIGTVPGTLIVRDRTFEFVPDAPWVEDQRYRLSLISGGNASCAAGELCGMSGEAASFDPLNGTSDGDSGGGNLVVDLTGAPASTATFLVATTTPFADVNGSGFRESAEPTRDANRAALRITGTTGDVSNARFEMDDCIPATPEVEACMYLQGAMPVAMEELSTTCPGGAATCVPVTLSAQAMYATSVTMRATAVIGITAETGTTVMRVREPPNEPLRGYIVDRGGVPTMIVALDLYMDAPDMDIFASSHDLHSKPLAVQLEGPLTFASDGRIAIELANVADVAVAVNIDGPIGIDGAVEMIVPAGEMRLALVSPPIRGVER